MRSRAALVAAVLVCALVACGARPGRSEADAGNALPAPAPSLPNPGPLGELGGVDGSARPAELPAFTLAPYRGLGAWLDVFDWSQAYAPPTSGGPVVGIERIDELAGHGVRTVFVQTARFDNPADVLEPQRLRALIDRAHGAHLQVVAWYLPTFTDVDTDLRRLLAPLALGVDGLAVDIEARQVGDATDRTRRLVDLVARLREVLGPLPTLGAIVLPPTLIEDVNAEYWPGYPWSELGAAFEVFLPMNYWTNRAASSPWRDAFASTAENIRRIRARTGRPTMAVHPIGGSAALVVAPEVDAMVRAAADNGAIGGSLYDFASTPPGLWPALEALRTVG